MEIGKREKSAIDAALDDGSISRRIYVSDKNSEIQFLVDTGADLCVYPRSRLRGPLKKDSYELLAANGTAIATYGTVVLTLNLNLCREWRFTVADVSPPILGVDFLSYYVLLVDARNKRLLDTMTNLSVIGIRAETIASSIRTISEDSSYHEMLSEFFDLTSS